MIIENAEEVENNAGKMYRKMPTWQSRSQYWSSINSYVDTLKEKVVEDIKFCWGFTNANKNYSILEKITD